MQGFPKLYQTQREVGKISRVKEGREVKEGIFLFLPFLSITFPPRGNKKFQIISCA
jgi:hypothetical protein